MKRTGEILRQSREKNGLSLHEIGLHIKINYKILKAIEDGDTSKLPAKTFLRGFVRSYATFLKMNVEEIMQVFQEEMGSTKPAIPANNNQVQKAITTSQPIQPLASEQTGPTKTEAMTQSQSDTAVGENTKQELVDSPSENLVPQGDLVYKIEKKRNALAMMVAGIGVALVIVVVVINKIVEKYTKETEPNQVTIQEPIDQSELNQQAAEATTENTSPEQAAIEQNESLNIENPNATMTAQAPVTSITETNKNLNTTPNQTVPANTASNAVVPANTIKVDPNAPIEKKIETDRNKPVELIVEAASDVEIQYSTQSGKIEIVKLKADQVHTFKSKQGLKVSISDAGAVNLILNGRDIGTPGSKGKQVNLSY